MRIHASSAGLDAATLRPGHDLVLDPAPWHGDSLPDRTAIDDFLGVDARREVERSALAATRAWRGELDSRLTVEGLCLPFIWELELYMLARSLVLEAAGIRAALEALAPATVSAAAENAPLVSAVAAACGIEVTTAGHGLRRPPRGFAGPRRLVTAGLRRGGVPSRLRPGSVLVISYWPLEPALDLMLAGQGPRPALMADKPPSRLSRMARTAASGGWVGTPGPLDHRRARRLASAAIDSLPGPPGIESFGVQIGPLIHDAAAGLARRRAAGDLARARMLRRLFARRPPSAILTAWDTVPLARLVIAIAREAGIRSYALQHGLYLPPTLLHSPDAIGDSQYADELLVWSGRNRHPARARAESAQVVGYPVPHPEPPPTKRLENPHSPRIAVLAQVATRNPPMDRRIEMRHWQTAIAATRSLSAGAEIVLRPHPSAGFEAARAAASLDPSGSVTIDARTEIEQLLANSDLCVGAVSAATLQAALVGTPVVALNLSGFEWEWPLGGATSVPVARSGEELRVWLERWLRGEALPGREEMLAALGAGGRDDPRERILEALARGSVSAAPASMEDGYAARGDGG